MTGKSNQPDNNTDHKQYDALSLKLSVNYKAQWPDRTCCGSPRTSWVRSSTCSAEERWVPCPAPLPQDAAHAQPWKSHDLVLSSSNLFTAFSNRGRITVPDKREICTTLPGANEVASKKPSFQASPSCLTQLPRASSPEAVPSRRTNNFPLRKTCTHLCVHFTGR